MAGDSSAPLTYLTPDIPGVGGVLRERPEDFLVEEQPLYPPSGTGEHLYLFIEKRELTTSDVVRRIRKHLRVGHRDIGFAGLKDKHAITRQLFSVWMPGREPEPEQVQRLDSDRCKVLWKDRHGNKLRRGHHAGNRFVIRIRQVKPTDVVHAKRVLDVLDKRGMPNYLGEQRFGYRGNNAVLGRLLLQGQWQAFLDELLGAPCAQDSQAMAAARTAFRGGDLHAALDLWPRSQKHERGPLDALRQGRDAQRAVMTLDRLQRDFLISAVQSAAFNTVLDRRLREGAFDTLLPGDLAWKHDARAVFAVDAATAELENGPAVEDGTGGRVAGRAVSPTGPMWGVQMQRCAEGSQAFAMEREALAATGLNESDLEGGPQGRAAGLRRPLREFISNADLAGGADEHGPYIKVAFELPRGVFATAALREVMKSAGAADGADGDAADGE